MPEATRRQQGSEYDGFLSGRESTGCDAGSEVL